MVKIFKSETSLFYAKLAYKIYKMSKISLFTIIIPWNGLSPRCIKGKVQLVHLDKIVDYFHFLNTGKGIVVQRLVHFTVPLNYLQCIFIINILHKICAAHF